MTWSLRPYRRDDAPAVHALWQAALGSVWPIDLGTLQAVLAGHADGEGLHVVAERNGRLVGLSAVTVYQGGGGAASDTAGLAAVVVHPDEQRRGLGRKLHDAALDRLRQLGVKQVTLGGGGLRYFWPGVPTNLPDAVGFFQACGWKTSEICADLLQDLSDYVTPGHVHQRMADQGIDIRTAEPNELPAIFEFEAREFVGWLPQYRTFAELGEHANILTAWDMQRQSIVGALLLFVPGSRHMGPNRVWTRLLGDDLGGLGAVGVAASQRGHGIGLALVARATEILRSRGVGHGYIDWVTAVDFYGRLGYRPWRDYHTSQRDL